MYPLPAALVAVPDTVAAQFRAELMEQAVTIEAEFPDVEAVRKKWPTPPESHRIFVVGLKSFADLGDLQLLNASFPGWPILAMVESGCDTAALLQINHAGAAQILTLPLIAGSVADALERLGILFGFKPTTSQLIAFSGVSEGAGSTSLAVNCAAEAAKGGINVLLMEMASGIGRLAAFLDLTPSTTTHDLLAGGKLTMAALQAACSPVEDHLKVLVGPYRKLELTWPVASDWQQLLRLARRAADLVIVDMPYTFDAAYFDAIGNANGIVLVAEQKVHSIQALRVVSDAIRGWVKQLPQVRVINRYRDDRIEFELSRLQVMLEGELWKVIEDPTFEEALLAGKTLMQFRPHAPALADVRKLLAAITNHPLAAAGSSHMGWLTRLKATFGWS